MIFYLLFFFQKEIFEIYNLKYQFQNLSNILYKTKILLIL